MLGYMTVDEAKAMGFTHHGKYFGIPVYMSDDEQCPMVCTKWAPMEYVMSAAHVVEGLMRSVLFPNDEPTFQFLMGRRL